MGLYESRKGFINQIKSFLDEHEQFRVDFHPDHFVLLNSLGKYVLQNAIHTLRLHYRLLKGMGMKQTHRCVLHVGGGYGDKEKWSRLIYNR